MSDVKIPDGVSTFTWWVRYPQGEPRTLQESDIEGFESSYVRCWNLITDRGWKRENKKWVSPDGRYKYNNVYEAYRAQIHWETIRKPDSE